MEIQNSYRELTIGKPLDDSVVLNHSNREQAAHTRMQDRRDKKRRRKPLRLLRLGKERDHAGRTHAELSSLSRVR